MTTSAPPRPTPPRPKAPPKPAAPTSVAKPVTPDAAPIGSSRPVVKPACSGDKSGCLYCPLLTWSPDFNKFAADYARDAEKIRSKMREGHLVRSRCLQESWTEVDVLFVAESPNPHEDKQAAVNAGGPGGMLKKAVKEVITEVTESRVGYTYVVRCNLPAGKSPTKTDKQACSPQLLREITARKPQVIVALGGIALEHLTGQSGINIFNGRIFDCILPGFEEVKVVACFAPGYVLYYDHEFDRFISALSTVNELIAGRHVGKGGMGEVTVASSLQEVEATLRDFAESGEVVAFDTETGSLNWWQTRFPRLLCFSFSNKSGTSFVIPFDHADSPWNPVIAAVNKGAGDERARIIKALVKFFEHPCQKVAQNGKFDDKHIFASLGVWPVNVRDTMLIHLTLDERQGTHGLKQLAYAYSDCGGYEKELDDYKDAHPEADPERDGSYANIPGDILFKYAGHDADQTIRAYHGLSNEDEFVNNDRFQHLAFDFFPRLSRSLAKMEFVGARINQDVAHTIDRKTRAEMAQIKTDINKVPQVRQFVADRLAKERAKRKTEQGKAKVSFEFNPGSDDQVRSLLYDYYKLKPAELTDAGFDRFLERQKKWNEGKPATKKLKWSDVIDDAIKNREWNFFSVKADVLHEHDRQGNELAKLMLKYRDAETLNGTFVQALLTKLDDDKNIHGSFMPQGTKTGRLSSVDPNLQNIPNKDGGSIKKGYISAFGDEGVLVQIDYSQIELRVAASYFNEPSMIDAYVRGDDLHTLTAIAISKLSPDDFAALDGKIKKGWRTRAKRVNFGVLYGGGAPALQSTLKKDGVFLTLDECQELIDVYFEKRPALRRGIDRLMEDVRRKGYLESFTGRRRRVPEVFSDNNELVSRALRQSVNFPIQSGASDMTLMSLVLICEEIERRGLRSRVILTVHDSIIFDCHVDEFMEVSVLAKEIMETIDKRSDLIMPGIDWSWLKCPIVAELDVGANWGSLVAFDPNLILSGKRPTTELWTPDKDGKMMARDPYNIDELWELVCKKAA